MGFSGSGGLAASSSNCCCGRRRGGGGRRRVSHSEKRSRPSPHETLGSAATEAETAMAEGFPRDTGRLRPRRDGEREESCVASPATQAQRSPAPGTRPCAGGSALFRHGARGPALNKPPREGSRLEITILLETLKGKRSSSPAPCCYQPPELPPRCREQRRSEG